MRIICVNVASSFRGYETAREAIEAVDADDADAVVYDAALLKYMARDEFANRVDVLPVVFNVQEYAIALPLEEQPSQTPE